MRKPALLLTLFLLFITGIADAQDTAQKTGFDGLMRSNSRIYVVFAVVLTILIGLIIYLVRLDRKITRLEKEK